MFKEVFLIFLIVCFLANVIAQNEDFSSNREIVKRQIESTTSRPILISTYIFKKLLIVNMKS